MHEPTGVSLATTKRGRASGARRGSNFAFSGSRRLELEVLGTHPAPVCSSSFPQASSQTKSVVRKPMTAAATFSAGGPTRGEANLGLRPFADSASRRVCPVSSEVAGCDFPVTS